MRRAIYTGVETFGPTLPGSPEDHIIALPFLQELSDFPCDIGSELKDLHAEVRKEKLPVDLSFVEENWTDKVDHAYSQ